MESSGIDWEQRAMQREGRRDIDCVLPYKWKIEDIHIYECVSNQVKRLNKQNYVNYPSF